MSITRDEAIAELQACVDAWDRWVPTNGSMADRNTQAVKMALSALRPVSREQVEKVWRRKWKCHGDCGVTECSACGWNIEEYVGDYNFCPNCGSPMTDKAVDIAMERLEELYHG